MWPTTGAEVRSIPEQSNPEEHEKEMRIIANGKVEFRAVDVTAEDVEEYDRQTRESSDWNSWGLSKSSQAPEQAYQDRQVPICPWCAHIHKPCVQLHVRRQPHITLQLSTIQTLIN